MDIYETNRLEIQWQGKGAKCGHEAFLKFDDGRFDVILVEDQRQKRKRR
jgi:hypothetical protein